MDCCRFTILSKISRYAALFLYPTAGLLAFTAGMLCAISAFYLCGNFAFLFLIVMSILAFVIAFFLFRLSVKCYSMESRKFSLSKDGIMLSDNDNSFYAWNNVQEVAIVAYAASASLQNYQTIICCFLKPKPTNFLHRILRSYIYGVMNQDNFIIIDFHPTIVERFSAVYPGEIFDYRNKQIEAG